MAAESAVGGLPLLVERLGPAVEAKLLAVGG